jgi:hypothetical protein
MAIPLPSSAPAGGSTAGTLPELDTVAWRPLIDEPRLRALCARWQGVTLAHTVPLVLTAALLLAVQPLTAPLAFILIAHAWIIPELYAQRGANVVRPKRYAVPATDPCAEGVALGLLGDLVGHDARALLAETGLVLERGAFGVWLVGEAGALLVRPGGRTVMCWCVRASEPTLPLGDRIAHLLLALRSDEAGFATVANLAFAGRRWRVRRRLTPSMRVALERAGLQARAW